MKKFKILKESNITNTTIFQSTPKFFFFLLQQNERQEGELSSIAF